MSRFTAPELNNMSGENYLINSTTVKINEPCSVRIPNQMPELMKKTRSIVGGMSTMDYEKPKDMYPVKCSEENLLEFSSTGQNKRCRRSIDSGIGPVGLLCYQDQMDTSRIYSGDFNGSTSKLPYRNIRTVNFCQAFADPCRDVSIGNNSKSITNPIVTQESSNIPSNFTTYSTNGAQINKIKTANSSGSSFLVQPHQSTVATLPPVIYSTDINDLRNQSKYIKSQNISFLQSDASQRKSEEDSMKSILNPKQYSYIDDGSLKFAECNNLAFGSSNKLFVSNIASRKDSVISSQSEFYETEQGSSGSGVIFSDTSRDNIPALGASDSTDSNLSTSLNKEEILVPSDFLYSNKFYLPTINVNEARNSISYIGQAIPLVMLNSNSDLSTRNLSSYPQFCLTQLIPFASDTVSNNLNPNDKNIDATESYLVLKRDFVEGPKLYCPQIMNEGQQKLQQFSSNNELSRGSTCAIPVDAEVSNDVIQMNDVAVSASNNSDQATEMTSNMSPVKTVGKFTISTPKVNDKSMSTLKSIENIEDSFKPSSNFSKYMCNENLNMNTNSGNQQLRSRFKKTRIRETIERWCINGLNTYDCRFKVIPSKIMNLRHKNQDKVFHEYHVQPCMKYGDRDNGYRCHSTEYYNKEFRFWDCGDRIAICGKSDYEIENYCQFHAKFINLLNQNQNLSLSKFEPQYFSIPTSSLGQSSPQIIRAVLISSPENENYTMNIDTNLSQNVALSAPPVSPSIMNSVPISSMPLNLHSPQPAASMVMLRCQTPVIFSSATRSATLMHESISIERINHKTSSKMCTDPDHSSVTGQVMDMWPNYSLKSDHLSLKHPSRGGMTESMFPGDCEHTDDILCNDQQPSLYSVGPIPHILYSIQQQPIPSISPGITSKRTIDHILDLSDHSDFIISDPLSVNVMQEIDNNLNSLKSLIHNLVQSEQQSLISDIKILTQTNDNLRLELCQMKKRSEYLERILLENQIPVDVYVHQDNLSMPDLSIGSRD